ncbi:zinc-ribbon domain-containing protein [Peptoniphilus sp. MSJ-1]|uniref:Zinc-ribbon domain-containing protein n=1 Tax=Peptoniphilus ovalis TaxID=2841503 RepID=A0ABS6FDS6_9FIRM|nr:zinc-ribbon domain-containing protein [Peptoniphilus ovalis]MBU5668320.1 zinc-ribbon domain-containing protein [Peptoniphilus ovalis]
MKCRNCGTENDDKALFCMDCGAKLQNDDFDKTLNINKDYEYDTEKIVENNSFKDNSMGFKQKGTIFAVVVVGLIAFSLIFNFGFNKYKLSKLESSAVANMESKNYDIAREKYRELYEKTENKKYLDEINKIDSSLESKENLAKATQNFENRAYDRALEYLENINTEDVEVISKKEKLKEKINAAVNSEISLLIGNNEYDSALSAIEAYIAVDSENEEFKSLKDKITTDKVSYEEKVKSEAQIQEQKARADELEAQVVKLKKSNAANLIGTYQYVTSKRANVRSGPGFSYGVSYSLYRGDAVYVFDTKSADGRTWCNIGNGWISYRTLNGEAK